MQNYQEDENKHVEEILNGFGIHTRDETTENYLSVNEVMISVGRRLKEIRKTSNEKYYKTAKEIIIAALLGNRYRYELSY